MSIYKVESKNAEVESSVSADELKNIQFPVEEKIVTTDMLDEKLKRINTLIHSKDCLLPKTIDASMEECDDFLNLISKLLDQKLLMARKCIHMSHFVEDIHALAALAATPAIVLAIFEFLALLSGSFNTNTTPRSIPILSYLPQELRPFTLSCIPLLLYLLYVYFLTNNHEASKQPVGGPMDIDEVVAEIYPKLKSGSDFFHDNERRQRFLLLVYALTGLWGVYLLGTDPLEFFSRLFGLLIVGSINFLVGLSLTSYPTFENSLLSFYSPLERTIRIISFSPILYAILTALGTLFVPIVTRRVDYEHLRDLSLHVITIIQTKFKGVLAIQKGMRNVRELLKVTTHFQDLAKGLASLEVNRDAGRALAHEVPKVASRFLGWVSGTVLEHLNTSPVRRQSRGDRAPRQEEIKENVGTHKNHDNEE